MEVPNKLQEFLYLLGEFRFSDCETLLEPYLKEKSNLKKKTNSFISSFFSKLSSEKTKKSKENEQTKEKSQALFFLFLDFMVLLISCEKKYYKMKFKKVQNDITCKFSELRFFTLALHAQFNVFFGSIPIDYSPDMRRFFAQSLDTTPDFEHHLCYHFLLREVWQPPTNMFPQLTCLIDTRMRMIEKYRTIAFEVNKPNNLNLNLNMMTITNTLEGNIATTPQRKISSALQPPLNLNDLITNTSNLGMKGSNLADGRKTSVPTLNFLPQNGSSNNLLGNDKQKNVNIDDWFIDFKKIVDDLLSFEKEITQTISHKFLELQVFNSLQEVTCLRKILLTEHYLAEYRCLESITASWDMKKTLENWKDFFYCNSLNSNFLFQPKNFHKSLQILQNKQILTKISQISENSVELPHISKEDIFHFIDPKSNPQSAILSIQTENGQMRQNHLLNSNVSQKGNQDSEENSNAAGGSSSNDEFSFVDDRSEGSRFNESNFFFDLDEKEEEEQINSATNSNPSKIKKNSSFFKATLNKGLQKGGSFSKNNGNKKKSNNNPVAINSSGGETEEESGEQEGEIDSGDEKTKEPKIAFNIEDTSTNRKSDAVLLLHKISPLMLQNDYFGLEKSNISENQMSSPNSSQKGVSTQDLEEIPNPFNVHLPEIKTSNLNLTQSSILNRALTPKPQFANSSTLSSPSQFLQGDLSAANSPIGQLSPQKSETVYYSDIMIKKKNNLLAETSLFKWFSAFFSFVKSKICFVFFEQFSESANFVSKKQVPIPSNSKQSNPKQQQQQQESQQKQYVWNFSRVALSHSNYLSNISAFYEQLQKMSSCVEAICLIWDTKGKPIPIHTPSYVIAASSQQANEEILSETKNLKGKRLKNIKEEKKDQELTSKTITKSANNQKNLAENNETSTMSPSSSSSSSSSSSDDETNQSDDGKKYFSEDDGRTSSDNDNHHDASSDHHETSSHTDTETDTTTGSDDDSDDDDDETSSVENGNHDTNNEENDQNNITSPENNHSTEQDVDDQQNYQNKKFYIYNQKTRTTGQVVKKHKFIKQQYQKSKKRNQKHHKQTEPTKILSGLAAWPCIFGYPFNIDKNSIVKRHWPNIISLLMDSKDNLCRSLEPLIFSDKICTYLISQLGKNLYFCVIYKGKELEKEHLRLSKEFVYKMASLFRNCRIFSTLIANVPKAPQN